MGNDSHKEIQKLREENKKLKAELQQTTERLNVQNELIKNSPFLAWAVNEKFEFIFISPAFKERYEQIFDYKLISGQKMLESIPPEYIPVWKERFAKAIKGEELIVDETVPLADFTKHYRLHISPIRDKEKITGIQVFTNDITQIIEAENKEISSLKKFHKILQHVEDVYYEIDMNGKILDVSSAIDKFTSYTREEVIGTNMQNFYANPKDRESLLKEISAKGQVKNYIIKAIDKGKKHKIFSINASLIKDDSGQSVKIAGILRDVTEIEQINKDLRWLRRAIEHSPVSIIITDINGDIEYTNPFFTKTTGYTKEEILGKNPTVMNYPGAEPTRYQKRVS